MRKREIWNTGIFTGASPMENEGDIWNISIPQTRLAPG